MACLQALKLQLLLPDHVEQSIDVALLLCLKLLVKLAQAWSSVVTARVWRQASAADGLRARPYGILLKHLARRGHRRVVELEVHEDG